MPYGPADDGCLRRRDLRGFYGGHVAPSNAQARGDRRHPLENPLNPHVVAEYITADSADLQLRLNPYGMLTALTP